MTDIQTICLTALICVESLTSVIWYAVWKTKGTVSVNTEKSTQVSVGEKK